MARKSDRNKSKKSPEKSPRRGGRSSRRRKKSDSVSSDEQSKDRKEKEQTTQEVETTSQNSEASGDGESERSKRSARRGQATTAAAPEAPAPASEEWVEDKQFWGAEESTSQPIEEGKPGGEEGGEKAGSEEGCEWKVQTSNGKGGVIQKLRICRTRHPGSESASELSPSPGKESPIPKRKASEGEGTESSESPDQPRLRLKLKAVKNRSTPDPEPAQVPVSGSEEDASNVKDSSLRGMPDSPVAGNVVVEQVADVSISEGGEHDEDNQANDMRDAELAAAVSSIIGVDPVFTSRASVERENVKAVVSEPTSDTKDVQELMIVDDSKSPSKVISDKEKTVEPKEQSEVSKPTSESPESMDVEKDKEVDKDSKLKDKDETMDTDDLDNVSRRSSEDGADEGVEINISPEEIEAATGGLDEATPLKKPRGISKGETKKKTQESKSSKKIVSLSEDHAHKKKEKEVEKDGKVSLRRSSAKEVEAPTKKSEEEKSNAESDQKEEGEIDTEQEETPKRTVRTNRSLSTASNTSQDSTGTLKSLATTARNHPLITGPEAGAEVKVRRPRKISVLSSAPPRTSTSGRQVRSIAGDALKSILPAVNAEIEKKESEKQAARDKILKVRSEKQQQITKKVDPPSQKSSGKSSKSSSKLPDLDGKMVVTVVDDVREVVNRIKEEKKEEKKSKSNSENLEPKPAKAVRKVVLASAAAPAPEEQEQELEVVKAAKPIRAASPGDSAATQVLYVTNLVRPFTANQLRDLLARTGTIAKDGFFIDKIKSKCFVKFTDVEMAIETRHALDGVRWPASNPKTLRVHYVSESEMETAVSNANTDVPWLSGHALANDYMSRVSVGGVREWDVGKIGGHEEEAPATKWRQQDLRESRREVNTRIEEPRREEPRKEEIRRQDARQDIFQRKRAFSPEKTNAAEPARKFKRKDHDGPAKLLDDLFRCTKAVPSLYWLPLSSAQIAVKEEMRRKHMAEHKRRIEMEKMELARREKERERRRK